jgi:1-acyl-sn-glycerol-3-phosphate acyltransferase
MRFFSRFSQIVYNLYAAIILLLLTVLLFPLVLFTAPLPEKKRGDMIYYICARAADLGMLLWGISHSRIYETPHDTNKPSIFVFNHISYLDALIILKAIRNQHFRGLGKFEISKIPLFGFIYKSAVIMVKRDSAEDRARSVADMKKAISQNISVVLAPEGTFNSSSQPLSRFYDGAFRIAIETQTPIKPILFLDAYDRMNYKYSLSLTPGRSRVVYLEEVEVSGYTLDDLPNLRQQVFQKMETALIRYKASWIDN